jgi:uncharacterized membrane protein
MLSDYSWWAFFFRWLHVLSGIMWIGHLWYFNFVQTPSMPKIPDEQKPAITKVIAPAALFWFRYGALATVVTGVILAYMQGYIVSALKLGLGDDNHHNTAIGFGMWMGLIMAFNVWFIIWPKQQQVLGLVEATADEKKRGGRMALLASRTNTMLSIPMVYAMTSMHYY